MRLRQHTRQKPRLWLTGQRQSTDGPRPGSGLLSHPMDNPGPAPVEHPRFVRAFTLRVAWARLRALWGLRGEHLVHQGSCAVMCPCARSLLRYPLPGVGSRLHRQDGQLHHDSRRRGRLVMPARARLGVKPRPLWRRGWALHRPEPDSSPRRRQAKVKIAHECDAQQPPNIRRWFRLRWWRWGATVPGSGSSRRWIILLIAVIAGVLAGIGSRTMDHALWFEAVT